MPIFDWRHYADLHVAPLWRSSNGSICPIINIEHLENSEEMLKKCLNTFVRLLNSAGPETDTRKVDALRALIKSIKGMIGMCQDLRWQVMIHEAQNEPASEKVCESPEEFLKKLWE